MNNDRSHGTVAVAATLVSYGVLVISGNLLSSLAERFLTVNSGRARDAISLAVYAVSLLCAISVAFAAGARPNIRRLILSRSFIAACGSVAASALFSALGFGTTVTSVPTLVAIISGVIIKPVLEELYFRGMMSSLLIDKAKISFPVYTVISAILFASIHPAAAQPTAFVAAVVYSYVTRDRFGVPSVTSSTVAHILHNAVGYLIYILSSVA